MPDTDKKRHSMTFRMRTDLRAAVEELAQANGRSLSEQIEHYVESSIFSEAEILYKYSEYALPSSLLRCIPGAKLKTIDVQIDKNQKLALSAVKCPNSKEEEILDNQEYQKVIGMADNINELNVLYTKLIEEITKEYTKKMTFLKISDRGTK